jgi:ribosomal protein S18 acetylase RimI-like enzyme
MLQPATLAATGRPWFRDMKGLAALSEGWRTDLMFARFDGELITRADCIVVRTPSNPTYWWGNFLLFDHTPQAGDADEWLRRFEAEIGRHQTESRHTAFGVDACDAFVLPSDFVERGFTLCASNVLTLRREQLRAPRTALPPGFFVAPLKLPEQAPNAVELQVLCDAGESSPADSYRVFRQRQMARYTAMARRSLGDWFGVWQYSANGEQLVADCGLFHPGPGGDALGRFQHVETHPAFRRRGLCSALMHAVCTDAFERLKLNTLVIVADPLDVAIGLYESLGFERGASSWHIERRPDPAAG